METIHCTHCGADITGLPHAHIKYGYRAEGAYVEDEIGRGSTLCDDCSLKRNDLHARLDDLFLVKKVPVNGFTVTFE